MKKSSPILSIFLFFLIVTNCLTAFANTGTEYNYKKRSNRMEGLTKVPMSGSGIILLSFLAYREPVSLDELPELRIRFYLSKPSEVFITALELRRHGPSHYLMKPIDTSWGSGWKDFFPWPSEEVLKPLKIEPNDIGITARLDTDRPGSGTIVPVVFYEDEDNLPDQSTTYTLHLLPKSTLARVNYSLVRVTSGETVVSGRLTNLPANVPFSLKFDLKNQGSGNYRIIIKSKELGRTVGPSRQYFFYHRDNLRN